MSDNDKQFDRRSVLKTIGSTAVAGIALGATSGSAAAIKTPHHLETAYSDPTRLRFAFAQHGEGVRQTLIENGIVAEDFDFGDLTFGVDTSVNGLEAEAADHSATVTAHTVEGTMTAIGAVSTSTDTHDITLYVQPERDEAYAFVDPKNSDERFVATDSELEPSSCGWAECTSNCCAEDTATKEYWECTIDGSGNCTDCFISDTACSCSDCSCGSENVCTQ